MTFTLTCQAGDLARALSLVSQVAGKEKQLPILRAVKISVARNVASFSATNMDHGATVTIVAEGEGVIYVDASLIAPKSAVLRADKPVTITAGKLSAEITQGRTRWKVPCLDGELSFPATMCDSVAGDPVAVPARPLMAAFAVAPDAVWPGVAQVWDMGALLDMGDGKFRIVSTNKKLLSVVEIDAPALQVEQIIFPLDAMAAVRSIFRNSDMLDIVASDTAVSISADGTVYRTKLIEGRYLNWRPIVGVLGGLDAGSVVDTDTINETVARATAIAEEKMKDGASLAITVTVADGELSASAYNNVGEEASDTFECDGQPGEFKVNSNWLRKMLGNIGSSQVELKYPADGNFDKFLMISEYPSTGRDNFRAMAQMRK